LARKKRNSQEEGGEVSLSLAIDEMQHFYGCTERYLLGLSRDRFWLKYKNMQVLEIKEEKRAISNFRLGNPNIDVSSHFYALDWRIEQLTGKPKKVDSLKDIKKDMDAKRKKPKKKKKKKDKVTMKK
jgi:hypothetical protein